MRHFGFAVSVVTLMLLAGCASQKAGVGSERSLTLSLTDRTGAELWAEEITVGETQEDEGYPLNTEVTGLVCVGTGLAACDNERELEIHLTLQARDQDEGVLTLHYQGQVGTTRQETAAAVSQDKTSLHADAPALPSENRYPSGDLRLVPERGVSAQLMNGLFLNASLGELKR